MALQTHCHVPLFRFDHYVLLLTVMLPHDGCAIRWSHFYMSVRRLTQLWYVENQTTPTGTWHWKQVVPTASTRFTVRSSSIDRKKKNLIVVELVAGIVSIEAGIGEAMNSPVGVSVDAFRTA